MLGMILLVCAAAASAAAGEAAVDTQSRLLARMDRNGDGKISFEEYRNAMLRRFDARDKNADGTLDGAEFPKEWLAGAGIEDATGTLTRDAFSDQLEPTFNRFDTDTDGQLAGAELEAFAAARKAREESKP